MRPTSREVASLASWVSACDAATTTLINVSGDIYEMGGDIYGNVSGDIIKCLRRQLLMSPPIPYMGGDISYMSPVTRTSNHLWTAVTHV